MAKQQQFVWRSIDRKCLSLLGGTRTRKSLFQIHAFMLRNAIETNVKIFAKFVVTCAPLAGILYARRMFDHRLHRDDTFLCNSMIKAHVNMRQLAESFTLYEQLRRYTHFIPDNFTFIALAKCCSFRMAIWEGLQLHGHIVKIGFFVDLYVSTALVDMYTKYGKMGWAKKVFDEMTDRSVVSWTALISGYARSGDMAHAKKLFDEMSETERGDSAVYNAMIDGYVKLGDMVSARSLFDEMPDRNVISWTSMIYGFCTNGDVIAARRFGKGTFKRCIVIALPSNAIKLKATDLR
ncbi:hypothetical protein Pint_00109 [Pistacia integerrima]|uniref:Uncharacterized protein n=1 Tax=Pistacia integerrima TaxID=434235 RepID=A0ACC0ZPB7_9ROSI|nr:hypothetical protein Pint_00109 [Pistacia integerrima]